MSTLIPRPAHDHDDVAAFFDACAPNYADQHGDADRLLRYRLGLLRKLAALQPTDDVLEIGCGTCMHLLGLADAYRSGIGTDLSPAMIEASRERLGAHADTITLQVDRAETLATLDDESVDVVLCVGALEHMLDQAAVCRSVYRVLRPGGRFALLTLNGGSIWYRHLAPRLGIGTRQLSTDHYLDRRELRDLLTEAGFATVALDAWTFVQRGDLQPPWPPLLDLADHLGRMLRVGYLRGGIQARAVKS
ncbi:MAG: methyltransferase domain-containing protein [Acidobacteriota bacterium]